MIPATTSLWADQSAAASAEAASAVDPLVQRYRALFALLDWDMVPERTAQRAWPGPVPHPRSAYIKALLIKLIEQVPSITRLRTFLVEHPLLVLEVGFVPVRDPSQPWGVAIERTVPGERWLRHQQQTIDHGLLQSLLAGTVHALAAVRPDLGTTVAVDVKHAYAWVRENNPKETIPQRFDPARQPAGDPDCRLGIKRRGNQTGGAGSRQTECLWGYGTGIVSAVLPEAGDVVLAEWTQPFHQHDVTYFQPLYQQASTHLGHPPTNVAADAAFDAWHVYQTCVLQGGIAAIPLNVRGPRPARSPAGHPLCDQGHVMTPTRTFQHEDGYQAQHYRCPLRGSASTEPGDPSCCDPRFAHGGCRKVSNLEPGGQARLTLDRTSAAYQDIYRQRTSAERINSQATALGIERPKVRSQAAVERLNTLTYVIINLRAIQRFHVRQTAHAHALPI